MKILGALLVVVLGSMAGAAAAPETSPEAAATVVLYNANDPASVALAKYYASKRAIPPAQLVGVPCSDAEEIARDEYLVTIEAPLRAAFTKFGWWEIARDETGRRIVATSAMRFVAVMRGVPLKVRSDRRFTAADYAREIQPGSPIEVLVKSNEASVDSELAALFALREELPAFIPNPYFRRFFPILKLPPQASPLLVCRLDGPSDAIVRRMIDNSIATEKTGLWGWAYLDARGITSGPYAPGDAWITAVGAMLRRQGVPVIGDYAPEIFPEGYPLRNAAIYYGWYESNVAGPFLENGPHFVPGAIAVHLHSFSARTIRDPRVAWVGPLLAAGADVSLGNVYEPYLELTVHFDVLQDRLMNGLTLGEAAYAAMRGLSWMGIVVGDPLYRPYAAWQSIDEPDQPPTIWQQYRTAVIAAGGDPVAAGPALHQLAARTESSMPLEALGQAQAAAGDPAGAVATLNEAAAMESRSAIRFRMALAQIEILRRFGRTDDARSRVAAALGRFPSDEAQLILGRIVLKLGVAPAAKP